MSVTYTSPKPIAIGLTTLKSRFLEMHPGNDPAPRFASDERLALVPIDRLRLPADTAFRTLLDAALHRGISPLCIPESGCKSRRAGGIGSTRPPAPAHGRPREWHSRGALFGLRRYQQRNLIGDPGQQQPHRFGFQIGAVAKLG